MGDTVAVAGARLTITQAFEHPSINPLPSFWCAYPDYLVPPPSGDLRPAWAIASPETVAALGGTAFDEYRVVDRSLTLTDAAALRKGYADATERWTTAFPHGVIVTRGCHTPKGHEPSSRQGTLPTSEPPDTPRTASRVSSHRRRRRMQASRVSSHRDSARCLLRETKRDGPEPGRQPRETKRDGTEPDLLAPETKRDVPEIAHPVGCLSAVEARVRPT